MASSFLKKVSIVEGVEKLDPFYFVDRDENSAASRCEKLW
jgi:hypothetical protein